MKKEKNIYEKTSNTIIMTSIRGNPPTNGHGRVFLRMAELKKHFKAEEALIYTTHSQDPKRNPIAYKDKIKFLKALVSEKYPELKVVDSKARNIIESLIELDGAADKIVVIAGQDRIQEFEGLLNKYNGKEYNYDSIKVISAGDRDPDSDSISGMSATKMRGYAANNDYQSFRRGIDSFNDKLIQAIFYATRKGMKIKEQTINVRDAHGLKALKEYCRLREEGDIPEESDSPKADEFLKRVSTLYSKAGIPFDGGDSSTEEESDVKMGLNEEGKALTAKYPDKDPSSYEGNVGILFLDGILGTKFITTYIGRYYDIFKDVLKGDIGGFRVVIRVLNDFDQDKILESLLNLKIAWDSEIGNPSYFQQAGELSMKIDFAADKTEELLKSVSGDKVYLGSIGSLGQKELANYISEFQKESDRLGLEKKSLDTTSMKEALTRYKMTSLATEAVSKDRDAGEILKGFATDPKSLKKEQLDSFSLKYGVDPRIISNYLKFTQSLAWKGEEKEPRSAGQFESAFDEIGQVLGLTPLLMLLDAEVAREEKKIKLDKDIADAKGGDTSAWEDTSSYAAVKPVDNPKSKELS